MCILLQTMWLLDVLCPALLVLRMFPASAWELGEGEGMGGEEDG